MQTGDRRIRADDVDHRRQPRSLEQAEAARRVGSRSGHLFPAALVASQFEALEAPHGEAGVLIVAATLSPDAQLEAALRWLGTAGSHDGAPP